MSSLINKRQYGYNKSYWCAICGHTLLQHSDVLGLPGVAEQRYCKHKDCKCGYALNEQTGELKGKKMIWLEHRPKKTESGE